MKLSSLVDVSLGKSEYFILHFPAQPFSEFVGEEASSHIYSCCDQHGCHSAWNFCFVRCVLRQIGLSEKLLRAPHFYTFFLEVPVARCFAQAVLLVSRVSKNFGFSLSNISVIVRGKFSCLWTRVWSVLPEGVQIYPIECRMSNWWEWGRYALCSKLSVLVLFLNGKKSFWRDFFTMSSNFLGGIVTTSCFSCPLTMKAMLGNLPFSPTGFLCALFPLIL